MKTSKIPLLGAHMSIAGGPDQAIERGQAIACNTIQIFTKSNRQWQAAPITTLDRNNFIQKQSSIGPVVAHASYLINLGSANKETEERSIRALIVELERCEYLQIPYLVLHPGSLSEKTVDQSLIKIAQNLDKAVIGAQSNTMILLENMAGQGSVSCYRFEHIAQIRQWCRYQTRIGVCFDTCHAFAAGYDFRTQEQYESVWQQFDAIVGLEHLKVIHLNDSKKALGSRVDRHEHIGEGYLGIEPFRLLMNDARFSTIPKILETPKETEEDDVKNLQILKSLVR